MFGSYLDRFYGRSSSWRKVRNEFIKNNNGCAACGRDDDLEVHHIVPYHVDPSLELDHNNLITLCGKHCHFIFGHLGDWKSWNKDIVEDSRAYYKKCMSRPHEVKFAQMPPESGYKYAIYRFIVSIGIFKPLFKRNNRPKSK
jgi:hypothetical protein